MSSGHSSGVVERPPKIYDVVELPESEKGGRCPRYTGETPTRCNGRVEYVFVHEASLREDDDRRRNCTCCEDCRPRSLEPGTDRSEVDE